MKKYSSLSNFFVSKTDKNTNILRTFYGKGSLINNKSNSKRNTFINNKSTTRIKNENKSKPKKKNNLNIFTNPSTFVKFQIFKNNIENKNHICKTRNNIHKNYHFGNFNSGSNSNIKKNKNKNFLRAMSYSPNKILTQFLYQYESNCKTGKNTFRKNINIKSTSPSSAQNRINNKRMKNIIKNNKRSKDLDYIIATSDKKRCAIIDNNIKALYGHSKTVNIKREHKIPPDTLYHGTSHNALDSIKTQGLLSMSRNYVHFSVDIETALIVGKRRDPNPIILQIDSKKAYNDGIKFYFGNDGIWLSDTLPPQYIKIIKE